MQLLMQETLHYQIQIALALIFCQLISLNQSFSAVMCLFSDVGASLNSPSRKVFRADRAHSFLATR